MRNRIVITGMGVVSPIGVGREDFYNSLKEGKSGIKKITGFKTESEESMYGGEIVDFGAPVYLGKKGLRHLTRSTKMLFIAGQLALMDSMVRIRAKAFPHYSFVMPSSLSLKLVSTSPDHREGIILGSTLGVFDALREFTWEYLKNGWRSVNPMGFTNTVMNSPAGNLAIKEKAQGINLTISSGHASSLDAIGISKHYLEQDQARMIFTGGTSELGPCIFVTFKKAGLLTKEPLSFNPTGEIKDGTLLGEGSVVFILEKQETAKETGAAVTAVIEGYGTSFDTESAQYQYDPEAKAAKAAIQNALDDAEVKASEIDFVSAGLSGHPTGDAMELKAIRDVLGPDPLIISIKSLIGETFDCSGAFQLAAALYIFENKLFTQKSTLNLKTKQKYYSPKRALITSFGFNGHNSALVVSR
ncbi:beta-ketoacyl-[acyl-carrier-protein] synthase family protein [Candidatus Margulisiibacteriota bacterium]